MIAPTTRTTTSTWFEIIFRNLPAFSFLPRLTDRSAIHPSKNVWLRIWRENSPPLGPLFHTPYMCLYAHALSPPVSLSLAHLNLSSTVKFLLEKLQERKRERKTSFARTLLLSSSLLMLLLLLLRRKKEGKKPRKNLVRAWEKKGVCACVCEKP